MGSGYNTNLSYNGLTNQINTPGYGYDANGNLTAMPALSMGYDVLNRMTSSASATTGTTTVYAYGPGGQRVGQAAAPSATYWQQNSWTIYLYGPDGRRIEDCRANYVPLNPQYPQQNLVFQTSCGTAYVYFRGKLVRKESPPALQDGVWVDQRGVTMGTDRLGSVHYWENTATTNYYPYGEEETPTANDRQKFATYTRDSATGLDYAQNRYYASQIGRFTTADPGGAGARGGTPQSWNRYAYVLSDPVNINDPTGMDAGDVCGEDSDDPGAGGICVVRESDGGGGDGLPPLLISFSQPVQDPVPIPAQPTSPEPPEPWNSWWGPPPANWTSGGGAGSGPGGRRVGPPSGAQFGGFFTAYDALLDKPGCAGLIAGSSGASADALQTDLWNAIVTVGTSQPGNGPVTFDTSSDGSYTWKYQTAYTSQGNIQLNGNYFPDPTQQNISLPGGGTTSLVQLVNQALGSSMTSTQFGAFVFLHELSHIAGGQPASAIDTPSFNQSIISTCLN
jgi:RHS repeat-associated protein